jgi:peptidoglycan/LPS O-acetylase OafA/YrhL
VGDARAAALYLANWRFAGQATAYSDTEVTESLLIHYWSLSIEEQFYVLWPLLIIGGIWTSKVFPAVPLKRALGVLLGLLIAVSFGFSVALTDNLGPEAYYLTQTRLWEMGIGAGLALVGTRLTRVPTKVAHLFSGAGLAAILAAILVGVLTFDEATAFPGRVALLPVLGAAALIVAGASGRSFVSAALARRPCPLISRLSYAWYLWHWPAIGIAILLDRRYADCASESTMIALVVAASLILAWASHHLIENPVRRHPRLQSSVRPSLVLGTALTLIPVLVDALVLASVSTGDEKIQFADQFGDAVIGVSPADAAADKVDLGVHCHYAAWNDTSVPADCILGDVDGDRTWCSPATVMPGSGYRPSMRSVRPKVGGSLPGPSRRAL